MKSNFDTDNKYNRRLWMRLGVTLLITQAEANKLLSDSEECDKLLGKILAEGRYEPDGDSYITEDSVECFNDEYGTNFEVEEYNFKYYRAHRFGRD